ncbi:phBC6A51 family helix-turn-helix protein [Guptibacillus hwajinpoensis]|uniref:phBC6A51 family helix-turn-helix protein n=1 Tax=Guptibacillus hwajinpoensis TaxID=208199 RepID=UPI0024B34C94|nr:phBC6A51 family helix-turn-helix protein [Pseudalkalibacillus hwajinpoensis]
MSANIKAKELIDAVTVPKELTERQITLAKHYIKSKMEEGFTVSEFCSSNSLSSKTWYGWMENPDFSNYVEEIQGAIIPDDEREAFQELKKKIKNIAYKSNPSVKEIDLFMDTFGYVVADDKKQRMEALGLTDENGKSKGTASDKSMAERKANLLSKLKGGGK